MIIMDEIIAPQDYYRRVRKIDWEGINKYRYNTGRIGEMLVFDLEKRYLILIGKESLANQVTLQEDGLGYDILSYFPDGGEKYIEVKSTANDINQHYYLSRRELEFLADNRDIAFVYRVLITDNIEPTRLKVYGFSEVIHADILPYVFTVKH